MLPQLLRTHAFKIIAVITTILPFIGYLIGYSYYTGYMEAFGLSGSEFPLTIPEIYFNAYLGVSEALLFIFTKFLISKNIFYYMFVGLSLSLVIYLIIHIKSVLEFVDEIFDKIMSIFLRRFIAKIKRDDEFRLKVRKIFNFLDKIFIYFKYSILSLFILQGLIVSIMLYWLPVVIFNILGQEKAIVSIQKFIKNDCIPQANQNLNACVSILDENKKVLYKGKFIAHNLSDSRIAIMQKNEINIIQLKPEYVINRIHYYK